MDALDRITKKRKNREVAIAYISKLSDDDISSIKYIAESYRSSEKRKEYLKAILKM